MGPMAQAASAVGGLSAPGKMPGKAFGFSAEKCVTGSKLRLVENSVCSDCYACKGMYTFRTVREAHARRFEALHNALTDSDARTKWTRAMVTLVTPQAFFRWHDSGDLQSAAHLALIADVCRATPNTSHWLPTREYRFVREYLSAGNTLPANLVIRYSAHMKNEVIPASAIPPGITASAVWTNRETAPGHVCPSRQQGNVCGDCRACWDSTVALVTYESH